MEFKKALELMKQGMKMKLPSWGGYWFYDNEKNRIKNDVKSRALSD